MLAVLKTGGKQYKVKKNDVIIVEKLSAIEGDTIQFNEILMVSDDKIQLGAPTISGAAVHAQVIEQGKNKKVISFIKRRRKHSSQRTRGHRQKVTVLRVIDILKSGSMNTGISIEVGSSIIASNPVEKAPVRSKALKKPAAKADAVKKPAAKADAVKKPAAKADAVKKPTAKAEVIKKPVAKKSTKTNNK
jgi:large subunit ribosomal protein L21